MQKEAIRMVKDPVCGMEIDPKDAAATRMHSGRTFYFCSQSCAEKFDADPHRYGHPDEHEHSEHHEPHEKSSD
jgi:P-type Cu+ transporter